MHRLRVVTFNALGNPRKVGGFGGDVRKWLKEHLRPRSLARSLWTKFKGEIDDACVHLCMFTSVTKKNFVRARWFDHFDHLVRFISGKRGAGAKLKNLLTKKGKFDEALAKRMEEDHRKIVALYGYGGKYESQKQRDCSFGGKYETQKQRDAKTKYQFGGKHETKKQRDARTNIRNGRGRKIGASVGLNVPPGAKCRVCGCDICTGRALTLQMHTNRINAQPHGSYTCTGKCKKIITFNLDQLKVMLKTCNKHKRLKGGVRGFVNSFVELWHKKNKKKGKGKKK